MKEKFEGGRESQDNSEIKEIETAKQKLLEGLEKALGKNEYTEIGEGFVALRSIEVEERGVCKEVWSELLFSEKRDGSIEVKPLFVKNSEASGLDDTDPNFAQARYNDRLNVYAWISYLADKGQGSGILDTIKMQENQGSPEIEIGADYLEGYIINREDDKLSDDEKWYNANFDKYKHFGIKDAENLMQKAGYRK